MSVAQPTRPEAGDRRLLATVTTLRYDWWFRSPSNSLLQGRTPSMSDTSVAGALKPRSRRARRAHAQPQEHRPHAAGRQADHRHRRQRIGQVVARLRHDLRRRAAALRRVAVGLRAAVPRADGEAGRRSHRRHLAGDRHPPEEQHPQSALDGRHDDRDPRLHAAAVRARRADLLPQLRPRSRARNGGGRRAAARRAAGGHAPADRLRSAGRRRVGVERRDGRRSTSWPSVDERRAQAPARDRRERAVRVGARAGARRRRAIADDDRERCGAKASAACSSTAARSSLDDVDPATLRDRADAAGRRRSRAAERRRSPAAADRFDRDGVSRRRRRGVGGRVGERSASPGIQSCIVFSERFECRACGIAYEDPQPRLFSFNNPFGACPTCHGFGNIIELDMDLVVPDPTKSIQQGAIEPWSKPHYRAQLAELKRAAQEGARCGSTCRGRELTDEEKQFVVEGDDEDYDGIRGFFRWLERKKYKVHVRVFLSRYRGYLTCPDCGGARLRREARDVRVAGRTIDRVSALTVREAQAFFGSLAAHREGSGDRRQGAEGDPPPAVVPERRRPRLPDARSPVVDAVGRRSAAHQPGDVARLGAGRHALRARRAVDRPALARQPAADRHPPAAARSGQHRARRRARRRHDQGRRSHRRSRARRRRAGRPRRLLRHARRR